MTPDYTEMNGGELINTIGTDAAKWAEAFCQHLDRFGRRIEPDWLLGWFANAMCAARDQEHNRLLNTPELYEFTKGVTLEALHQRQRWGEAHDRSKSAENWYWLVGYLAGKALRASIEGDKDKALHHTISAAAALSQWHAAIMADESWNGEGLDADLRAKAEPLGAAVSRSPAERGAGVTATAGEAVKSQAPQRPDLDALIERARQIKMSPEDWFEQRVSFVYGQLPHDSKITKDEVRAMLRRDVGASL